MTTDLDGVLRRIEATPGLPADEAQVRGQREYYYPATWKAKWPEGVPKPPVLTDTPDGTHERRYVTRDDVFAAAADVTTEADALDLYVEMCGWGAGWQGQTGYRCRLPLQQPGVAATLLRTHRQVREGLAPAEAYRRMDWGGPDKIKHLGPSFFTKWLYFSGYDRETGTGPLILDQRVARALGWAGEQWTHKRYGEYLDVAADLARRLRTTPHVVEHALFTLGGAGGGADADIDPDATGLRDVVVPDLADGVVEVLRSRADAADLTLPEYLRELLTRAADD